MGNINQYSILFCVTWLVFLNVLHAEYISYEGHQLWKVTPKNDASLKMLRQLYDTEELDFWKDPIGVNRPVDIRVPPNRITHLRKHFLAHGLSDFEVIVDNIQTLIDEERIHHNRHERGSTKAVTTLQEFDYSVYHDAEEVYQWIDIAANQFEFIEKKQVGVTYQGRKIFSLEIRKPNPDVAKKPLIYVDSLIHCREWITTSSLLFIFKEMLTNPMFSHMIDDVDWDFVPMINVDGYVETWTGDRLWRKTKSSGPSSLCTGVDGNRNWDDHWSGTGASRYLCSLTYYGPIAASESEIRHLQKYIIAKKDEINAVVSVHSYGQLILFPYNYDYVLTANNTVLNEIGKLMSDAIYSKHNKRYVWGPGATTIYVCSGVTTDWTYNKAGIDLSYTYELRDEYGFILPADQIIPTGEEFLLGLEILAEYVK